MATLNATLTLASTDATSDALSMTVTDSLTTGPPSIGISKVAIAAGGGDDTTLVASSAGNKYVYIKHTGFQSDGTTATSNEIVVDFGTTDSIRLSTGEFAFFPVNDSNGLEARADTASCSLEYAYWKKG